PPPSLTHGTIVEWEVAVEPGDPVRPLRSSTDRLGTAVIAAADATACVAAVAELTALPIVTTQPDATVPSAHLVADARPTARPGAGPPGSTAPPSTAAQPAPVA
ncbi:hypothetical protein ACWGJW_42750, partial [Streptomyces nigrescens]